MVELGPFQYPHGVSQQFSTLMVTIAERSPHSSCEIEFDWVSSVMFPPSAIMESFVRSRFVRPTVLHSARSKILLMSSKRQMDVDGRIVRARMRRRVIGLSFSVFFFEFDIICGVVVKEKEGL